MKIIHILSFYIAFFCFLSFNVYGQDVALSLFSDLPLDVTELSTGQLEKYNKATNHESTNASYIYLGAFSVGDWASNVNFSIKDPIDGETYIYAGSDMQKFDDGNSFSWYGEASDQPNDIAGAACAKKNMFLTQIDNEIFGTTAVQNV
ncbi:MAG: hypothetical protein AB8F78_10895 [Saprospiraceae bacterium]